MTVQIRSWTIRINQSLLNEQVTLSSLKYVNWFSKNNRTMHDADLSFLFRNISCCCSRSLGRLYSSRAIIGDTWKEAERRVMMAEIPIQSRLDKSLKNTRTFLNKSINVVNEGNDKHEHLSLLMENQRIEDAYLIKESESKIQV